MLAKNIVVLFRVCASLDVKLNLVTFSPNVTQQIPHKKLFISVDG